MLNFILFSIPAFHPHHKDALLVASKAIGGRKVHPKSRPLKVQRRSRGTALSFL
jgi:hypothetical protein